MSSGHGNRLEHSKETCLVRWKRCKLHTASQVGIEPGSLVLWSSISTTCSTLPPHAPCLVYLVTTSWPFKYKRVDGMWIEGDEGWSTGIKTSERCGQTKGMWTCKQFGMGKCNYQYKLQRKTLKDMEKQMLIHIQFINWNCWLWFFLKPIEFRDL